MTLVTFIKGKGSKVETKEVVYKPKLLKVQMLDTYYK